MAILYQKEGKIVTVTLNRPEVLNAFDPATVEEFSQAMLRFRDDSEAWVAIITGAGDKAFSAGADLKRLLPVLQDKNFEFPPSIVRGLHIWKPLIAAVNGAALGSGLEIVLSCDIRIAAESAIFGTPEVRWGIIPGWGGTQRLPRMIPWARAAELLLVGDTISASEAYQLGVVNRVVPLAKLMPVAKEVAHRICENGPLAVRAAKQAMMEGVDKALDDGLELEKATIEGLLATEDAREGLKAFAEKRKPIYKCK